MTDIKTDISRRRVSKLWKVFGDAGKVDGIDSRELAMVAAKMKKSQMVSTGEMSQIGADAETEFRKYLEGLGQNVLKYYLRNKEDGGAEDFRFEGVLESEFKTGYINQRIGKVEDVFYRQALEKIITRRISSETEKVRKQLRRSGLHREEDLRRFVYAKERSLEGSLDISTPSAFDQFLINSVDGQESTFVYYLCLRWKNGNGLIDIAPDLNAFQIINSQGTLEERDGTAKKFQIQYLNDFASSMIPLISARHELVVADFDLMKFRGRVGEEHYERLKQYVGRIKERLGPGINISRQTDFFKENGFDEAEYNAIFTSLLLKDSRFFPDAEFNRELEHNLKSKSRFLNNWDAESNRLYTASTIARNIAEGLTLSRSSRGSSIVIFDKNSAINTQFNSANTRKVPVICFPMYHDGVGGMRYA